MTAQAGALEEAGRGGADDAAWPGIEVEAGRGDADSAARLVTGEGGAGEDAQERPSSQTEVVLALLKYPFYPLFNFDNGMNLI